MNLYGSKDASEKVSLEKVSKTWTPEVYRETRKSKKKKKKKRNKKNGWKES